MIKTCVLIPSYNEAKAVGALIEGIKARGLDVYVVDDGSTDGTAEVAGAAGAVVIVNDRNKGKGASLIEGFRQILKKDYVAILIMDGDGQHEVSDVDKFLAKAEDAGVDIVIGNRMSDTAGMPLERNLTNRVMSRIISYMCKQEIPDTQCGFKLIKRKVLEGIDLKFENFEIESEILVKAARKGFRIVSVPIKTVYGLESSKIKPIFDTVRFLSFLARMAFR